MSRKAVRIEGRSIVSGRNLEPYVTVFVLYDDGTEEQVSQWTPEEATHHALVMLETAEAAQTDAFLTDLLTMKVGLPLEQAAGVLNDFRKWRDRRRPPEKPQ